MGRETLDDWQSYFDAMTIEQLITYPTKDFPSCMTELTAIYSRFIDIAFIDATKSNHIRALSASWAKVIESIAEVNFYEDAIAMKAFSEYRDATRTIALEQGYGSALFAARHEPEKVMSELLSDVEQNPDINSRRIFLSQIAFGREADFQ